MLVHVTADVNSLKSNHLWDSVYFVVETCVLSAQWFYCLYKHEVATVGNVHDIVSKRCVILVNVSF
jgi:hypothetical protein